MGYFEETFAINTQSKTDDKYTIDFDFIRVSVLTSRLLRVELKKDKKFCDMPTQAVWYRNFDSPAFKSQKTSSEIKIETDDCTFVIDAKNAKLKAVALSNGKTVKSFKKGNLKGTKRTLDFTYGKIKIGSGILSKNGVAVFDDSESLVICDDGFLLSRRDALSCDEGGKDYYIFAYDRDYKAALKDFFKLTGETPLLPRYSLGNWWSRYKAYSQEEYLDLMKRFVSLNIPITIATVDMDWHWVKVIEKFGDSAKNILKPRNISELNQGWTGYSWNTELFPDYKEFLNELKENGFHITVNLHPSMGVRWFEDMYEEFCRFLGRDSNKKEQILFDLSDKKFIEGYFKFLHHKYEADGVDFWWIDWQQGKKSQVEGLDPLWALNHYHFLDMEHRGKRPLILSRFAGVGSHRYPLGFSGDASIYWSVLDFQPYFTSTASNIGYGWWSHDIGGHRGGKHDDELYLRWVQFGVFSPINRLHSTSNELMGKEPWKYSYAVNQCVCAALRFRHRLIPYIYTMNYRCHTQGEMLLSPMYYEYPNEQEAYSCKNEYFFGSELIVAPITRKTDKKSSLAYTDVWLPKGRYTDIFTNRIYQGGSKIRMFRDIDSIPVLAKEGAIIPLDANDSNNSIALPETLEILLFSGTNTFSMYEDDGESCDYKNGKFALTEFSLKKEGDQLSFSLKASGDLSVLPQKRSFVLSFRNVSAFKNASVKINSKEALAEKLDKDGFVKIFLNEIEPNDEVSVTLYDCEEVKNPDKGGLLVDLASRYAGFIGVKNVTMTCVTKGRKNIFTPKTVKQQMEELNNLV